MFEIPSTLVDDIDQHQFWLQFALKLLNFLAHVVETLRSNHSQIDVLLDEFRKALIFSRLPNLELKQIKFLGELTFVIVHVVLHAGAFMKVRQWSFRRARRRCQLFHLLSVQVANFKNADNEILCVALLVHRKFHKSKWIRFIFAPQVEWQRWRTRSW